MKVKIRYVLIPLTIITLAILSATPILAQGQPITASVDRTRLTTDDTLVLTVSVNADTPSPPNPSLPALNGFAVVGSSSSSQISIINGTMSAQVIYSYRLQPFEAGNLTIEPVSVILNGQTYNTQPITIQVTQGTGMPTSGAAPSAPAPLTQQPAAPTSTQFAGQETFVEAEVDNANPYLGEQVTYTFRFYQAADDVFSSFFDQPQFEPPAFKGFWTENQPDQNQYRVQYGGRLYNVTELRTVLFPTVAGPITIEPAMLTVSGSFFSRGGRFQTQPVSLDVKQLPANAPASFSGAVGQYQIQATVDTTQSKVNEPITWQVTLSGQGNLNTVADPNWPDIDNWRSFESQATINTQMQNGTMVGTRTYERLLVPQAEGEYTVPGLEYTYFDPTTGQYQTISTQAVPISIAPGNGTITQSYVPVANPEQENVEQVATDIRHLKPAPDRLNAVDGPITESPLYWLAWGIPLMGLVGNFVWQRRQQFWQNNTDLARSSKAHKKAKQALAQVSRQSDGVYSAAAQILNTYLADKLNQPVVGLTQPALAQLLAQNGLNPDLIERVKVCLMDAELGHYSPDAGHPDHAKNLLKEIDALIKDLEKAL